MKARAACALMIALAGACKPPEAMVQEGSGPPPGSAPVVRAAGGAPVVSARATDPPAREADRDGIRVVVASEESDALSLVRTERLKARAEGRVLVVYAGASWCEPCKRMKEAIHTGRLDDKLPRITLLAFDADRDTERLASAGYHFQFIPYVALPGADGHPADAGEASGKGSQAWRALLAKLESWQKSGP